MKPLLSFEPSLARRRRLGSLFSAVCLGAVILALLSLVTLLLDIMLDGLGTLSWDLLARFPSRNPTEAGLKSALYGTVYLMGLLAFFSFPLGVGAAVYLETYAPRNWLTRAIEVNITNLAGVPSIIYGLLGLGLFVRALALGRSLLAGALTMTLLVLPIIIVASREAIRSVPASLKEASYALGATRWQTVSRCVLPLALPGILTGTILAFSRAIGETAPLITIGALTYVAFTPTSVLDGFTVLPIQIFNWISRPQPAFHALAASGIIVLLAVMLATNALAVWLRYRLQGRARW